MATTKAIKVSKPRKKVKPAESENIVNGKTSSGLSEQDIRIKAEEIYYQRIERGEDGTADNDWFTAIEVLSDSN